MVDHELSAKERTSPILGIDQLQQFGRETDTDGVGRCKGEDGGSAAGEADHGEF